MNPCMAETLSVAVLGTGIMGAPIARNLAGAGVEVRAWNRSRDKADPLADAGVRVEDDAAAAAGGADIVLTMLSDGDAVEAVMTGGALAAMRDDALWLQASTIGVAACERMLELASERGVTLVDCPVIGTKQPAEEGKLTVLAAGPEEARERCAPVFDAIGQKTVWFERACGASRMKVVVNSWLLAMTSGLAESIAVARALDVEPGQFLEILDGAPMGSPYAQLKGKAMIEHSYDPAFPLSLAGKDAALVVDAAEANGIDPALARTVLDRYQKAAEEGHGDADMAAVHEAWL
jgi:3-hydroxyisobutyrate dehydrogenase